MVLLTPSSSESRYSAELSRELADERDEAAAVDAVVAEVPILPRFKAVGRATSERNDVVAEESDGPSVVK